MQDLEPAAPTPITFEQTLRLLTRVFSASMLYGVVVDLIAFPRTLLSLAHYLHETSGFSLLSAFNSSYWLRYYVLSTLETILFVSVRLLLAGWFYRCAPRVHRFLTEPSPAA